MGALPKLLILSVSLLLTGCAARVGQTRMIVFGFGVVTTQGPTNAPAAKVDSTIIGVGINDGATLGFKKNSVITVETNANVIIDSSPKHTVIQTY